MMTALWCPRQVNASNLLPEAARLLPFSGMACSDFFFTIKGALSLFDAAEEEGRAGE